LLATTCSGERSNVVDADVVSGSMIDRVTTRLDGARDARCRSFALAPRFDLWPRSAAPETETGDGARRRARAAARATAMSPRPETLQTPDTRADCALATLVDAMTFALRGVDAYAL
jgi:hypothetical protein